MPDQSDTTATSPSASLPHGVEGGGKLPKDDLALTMMAAWCNVSIEQLPDEARYHPNDYTRQAWDRVGRAAMAYLAKSLPATKDDAR